MRTKARVVAASVLLPAFISIAQGTNVIDDFSSPEAWRPIGEAPAPAPDDGGGLILGVPFASGLDRVYWDRDGQWDLSSATAFQLELGCDHPAAMRSLAIYCKSGNGWYIWSKPLQAAGRQIITLRKTEFTSEGHPAGWNNIEKIRVSPWKGQAINTSLTLFQLTARMDRLYLIQANASAPNDNERSIAKKATERLSRWLNESGISHAIVDEEELPSIASQAGLIVLPYNPKISADGIAALEAYVKRGGKMMVFYSADHDLAKLMHVKLDEVETTRDIARWRGMTFNTEAPPGLPAHVHQQSWSIGPAHPVGEDGRIIAWWANAAGQLSTNPAVIATSRGYWFTHILLDDDTLMKQRLLTGLLASLDETIWREAADHARLNAGRVDHWRDALESERALTALAEQHEDRETILAFIRRTAQLNRAMNEHYHAGRYRESTMKGYELASMLMKTYGLAQKPLPDEFRAVWDHDGTGWYPGDWDRTARLMAESGINAILVNATWTGLAHYPSDYLPESFSSKHYGDQLAACIRAARQHNIQVHAWVVCWALENSRPEFTDPLRNGDRLQRDAKDNERLWMNPAHPENREHLLNVIREIAENYEVDGIHLDYIRYPGSDACYASYTHRQFASATGITITNWPRDVLSGGEHHESFVRWRADVITSFVREVRKTVKEIKPSAKLSAAVWGGYPQIITSIGQDWGAWMEEGLLDFVMPMNYANDLYRFTAMVDQQLPLPGVRGRIYPGIGVTANESQLRGDQVVEQIIALRQRGIQGFALFDLSQTLIDDTLPTLRMGVTRP